jgi:hypothetical protein
MAYPEPLPTLNSDDFRILLEEMESFEISEDQQDRIDEIRAHINSDD